VLSWDIIIEPLFFNTWNVLKNKKTKIATYPILAFKAIDSNKNGKINMR
jgi:hypothetical protein